MAGSRKMSVNSGVKSAHERPTKEEIHAVIRRIEQRANIAKIYAEPWQGEANSPTGDDQRLASLKAGHCASSKRQPGICGPAEKQSGDKLTPPSQTFLYDPAATPAAIHPSATIRGVRCSLCDIH
jgi:hypothetical protein